MKISGFLLFRLNFVDRQDLFSRPLHRDSEFTEVVQTAATSDFDLQKQGRRSGYRWALREVVTTQDPDADRPFVSVMLSYEVISRRGPIIMADRIDQGISTVNPPTATLVRIVFDLKRHICAVEDVTNIIQSRGGWRRSLETILSSAAWQLGFTSLIRFDPVIPTEIIQSEIKSFERITRLRVTLRLPNPDLGPSYQRLYEEMQRGGVRELTEDMRNERGLKFEADSLPQAALDMASNGYRKGKIRVYGYKDGEPDQFTISDDVARIEIEDVRSFVEGYSAAQRSNLVHRFADTIIRRIDESLSR